MLLGEIVEQGPTLEIFLRPKQKQTELYIEGRYG
jgi:ABC-type phosphate transport system ATPase subunit